jgi:hypothetical protein
MEIRKTWPDAAGIHHLILGEAHVLHLHASPALDAPALSSSKDKKRITL